MKLMIQCAGGDWKWRFQSVRDFCRYFEWGKMCMRDWRGVIMSPESDLVLLISSISIHWGGGWRRGNIHFKNTTSNLVVLDP
jgi:hypothetical protein